MERKDGIKRKVFNYIKENHMIEQNDTVVVGVSGGADSMCLLHLLLELRESMKIYIEVVHINHGIRGDEAKRDMSYVEESCKKWGVNFHGFRYDIPKLSKELHMSSEEAGRLKRYEAFNETLNKAQKINKSERGLIAVAHNMDDNSETFLLNLFRGTGLQGLSGITPVRDNIVRPVLCLKRNEIEEYLKESKIEYKTDSTNLEDIYTRNKIRLNLLPFVSENINERAKENINRTAQMLTEVSDYMNKVTEKSYKKYVVKNENEYVIGNELFLEEDDIIISMVIRMVISELSGKLKDVTKKHVESVMKLYLNQVSRRVDMPYKIRAVRMYDGIKMYLTDEGKSERKEFCLDIDIEKSIGKTIEIREGEFIEISKSEKKFENEYPEEKIYTKWMNCDILKGSLSLRNRRQKDYMVIDFKGRKKKLKDILIDMKIPKDERDNLLLLAKDSEVLWIVGYRMSERCKINKNTTDIVKVQYKETKNNE